MQFLNLLAQNQSIKTQNPGFIGIGTAKYCCGITKAFIQIEYQNKYNVKIYSLRSQTKKEKRK